MQPSKILERNFFHAGKTFIRAGEQNMRAHVIQKGMVVSYIEQDGQEIEVGRYGPGTIIGEISLILDDPLSVSYKALTDITVVSISRQDFEKKLAVADGTIRTILRHIVDKANTQEKNNVETIIKSNVMDETAMMLIQAIVMGMGDDKKRAYELAITPHVNGLVTAIKATKESLKNQKIQQLASMDDSEEDDQETQNLIRAASYLVERDRTEGDPEDDDGNFDIDENKLQDDGDQDETL